MPFLVATGLCTKTNLVPEFPSHLKSTLKDHCWSFTIVPRLPQSHQSIRGWNETSLLLFIPKGMKLLVWTCSYLLPTVEPATSFSANFSLAHGFIFNSISHQLRANHGEAPGSMASGKPIRWPQDFRQRILCQTSLGVFVLNGHQEKWLIR